MTVDVESFLESFPEFRPAEAALIKPMIAKAVIQVDAAVWGTLKTDLGVELLTAHLLAISPFGQNARLVSKDGSTTYGKRFDAMVKQVTPGFRVI